MINEHGSSCLFRPDPPGLDGVQGLAAQIMLQAGFF